MAGPSSDLEAAVIAANAAFYSAFNDKDPVAMETVWSRRDDISCVHPGWNLLRGRAEVIDSWQAILANPNQPRIVAGSVQVMLAEGAAIVTCRELVSASPLAATNVFVQEGGVWKLIHHHSGPVSSLQQSV